MGIASRIRWKIGGLLCTVAVVNYFQRVNISVAGDSIMKDFHLTQTQMGTVFSAFVLGYTLFQVPGGMLADRFGPRRVLGCAMATWGIFTFLSGIIGRISLLTGLSVLNGNFRFQPLLGSRIYTSRPVESSSDRHGLFWVASRLTSAVQTAFLICFPPPTCVATIHN